MQRRLKGVASEQFEAYDGRRLELLGPAPVPASSIGKWRIPEQASGHQPPTAVGPSMSPDVETLAGTFSEVRLALEKMEQELAQMSAIQAAVTR